VSGERDVKRLLKFRSDLEARASALQFEIGDLKKAMAVIDGAIVQEGFRQPGGFQPMSVAKKPEAPKPAAPVERGPSPEQDPAGSQSVQAKDGTVLGKLAVTEREIVFTPREGMVFLTSTPPFQSFLVERVLQSMKESDEQKAAAGELDPSEALGFQVEAEGEEIRRIMVRNYGGERRLREIQSGFRWSLDKMYDKARRG
jgi:hypothetical protein